MVSVICYLSLFFACSFVNGISDDNFAFSYFEDRYVFNPPYEEFNDRWNNASKDSNNLTIFDRGIARLSVSSIQSNMLFERFFGKLENWKHGENNIAAEKTEVRYGKFVLPKRNVSGAPVTVKLLLTLIQLGDVDERNQIMSTMIWVNHEWRDASMTWNPADYGGITMLHIPSEMVWVPDTVLYNNADGDYQLSARAKVSIHYSGTIRWEPPAIYRSFCLIDVTYFPFDDQACTLKIGPWTYDLGMVNYVHLKAPDSDFILDAIDRSRYFESVEWQIIAVPGLRNEAYYEGLVEGYVDITFTLLLRRKALFYTVNLIAPCLCISLLTVFVFYLPSESCEKVTLSISILLSLTFFIVLLADLVPPTSLIIPLIGKYLLFTMALVTFSIMSTVIVLSVFQNPMNAQIPLPMWVRYTFLKMLPRLLFMDLKKVQLSSELLKLEASVRTENLRKQRNHEFIEEDEEDFEEVDQADFKYHRHGEQKKGGVQVWSSDFFAVKRHHTSSNSQDLFNTASSPTEGKHGRLRKRNWKSLKKLLIRNALEDVGNIVQFYVQAEREEFLKMEWEAVARVLDRLFFCLYSASCFFGVATILMGAPSLWAVDHKELAAFQRLADLQNQTLF